jgi:hypothetical protein
MNRVSVQASDVVSVSKAHGERAGCILQGASFNVLYSQHDSDCTGKWAMPEAD